VDAGRSLSSSVRRLGAIAWSLLGTLLFVGAVIWTLAQISDLVAPIVLAIALIYILNPVVSRLQATGVPRLLGSCLSYLGLLGLFTLAGVLVIPSIGDQAADLGDRFPTIYDDFAGDVEDLAGRVGVQDLDVPRYDELADWFRENQTGFLSRFWDRISSVTLSVLQALLVVLVAPVIAFYVLIDLPKLRRNATDLLPPVHRDEVVFVMRQVGTAIGGFLRGQLMVAFIVGVLTSVGFLLIGLPFWLIIGMTAGFLNIIPFVGPWVGGALGVLVAVTTQDLSTAVWAAVVAAAVQQLDNHFISPTVLRATVRLHPATIILALLAGGSLAGLFGVLLAVPTVAIVKIIVGHLWRTRVLGQSWAEVTEALIDDQTEPGFRPPWRRNPPAVSTEEPS